MTTPSAAPARLRVTWIRPYDAATNDKVTAAIERAGADIVRTFADPVNLDEARAYLEAAGKEDRLLFSYHGVSDPTALELIGALHRAAGVPRRVLVIVPVGDVTDVRTRLLGVLPFDARSRVMAQVLDQILSIPARRLLAAHLQYIPIVK